MIGIQTGPSGEGWRFHVDRNAAALGIARRGVHQIIRALIEQGYIVCADDGEECAYRLAATRPAIEMDEHASTGRRSVSWSEPGPATAWLAEETSAWTEFTIDREQLWRKQAAADPEFWRVGIDAGTWAVSPKDAP
jgi:hypothetical protein